MSETNLQERLEYFERRLSEAKTKAALKEPHPRDFDAGYTTERCKTWADTIKLINSRISSIKEQMK